MLRSEMLVFRDHGEHSKAICPHIQIVGTFFDNLKVAHEDEGFEYTADVRIVCNICVKTFTVIRIVG